MKNEVYILTSSIAVHHGEEHETGMLIVMSHFSNSGNKRLPSKVTTGASFSRQNADITFYLFFLFKFPFQFSDILVTVIIFFLFLYFFSYIALSDWSLFSLLPIYHYIPSPQDPFLSLSLPPEKNRPSSDTSQTCHIKMQ